jgi:hypothetical protein
LNSFTGGCPMADRSVFHTLMEVKVFIVRASMLTEDTL